MNNLIEHDKFIIPEHIYSITDPQARHIFLMEIYKKWEENYNRKNSPEKDIIDLLS